MLSLIKSDIKANVVKNKYAVAKAEDWNLSAEDARNFAALQTCWDDLGPDKYYGAENPANYRVRRYSDFLYSPKTDDLRLRDHVAYYQSKRQNPYAGGQDRHFEDVLPETYGNPFFKRMVSSDFAQFPVAPECADRDWVCQVHMIRIVVGPNQETPVTPEGIHSDGYPFAGVHLIAKRNIRGGESRVYSAESEQLDSLTFENPLDSLWIEDRAMKHYVTPIASVGGAAGHRDLFAVSFSLPDSGYVTDK